jgi:hypothetical protein
MLLRMKEIDALWKRRKPNYEKQEGDITGKTVDANREKRASESSAPTINNSLLLKNAGYPLKIGHSAWQENLYCALHRLSMDRVSLMWGRRQNYGA